MTYFTRDDSGPFDDDAEREHNAWRDRMILAATHGKEVGCLFPGDHEPGHPVDMRFHVSMHDRQGRLAEAWENLTEAEMVERYEAGATGAMLSSQFDFWWEG